MLIRTSVQLIAARLVWSDPFGGLKALTIDLRLPCSGRSADRTPSSPARRLKYLVLRPSFEMSSMLLQFDTYHPSPLASVLRFRQTHHNIDRVDPAQFSIDPVPLSTRLTSRHAGRAFSKYTLPYTLFFPCEPRYPPLYLASSNRHSSGSKLPPQVRPPGMDVCAFP